MLMVSLVVMLATLVKVPGESIHIPFSTASGESGTIEIEIPTHVWVGDRYRIRARIEFDTLPERTSVILIGRMETTAEESSPRGDVRLSLDTKTPVVLEWTSKSNKQAAYPGILWLWLESDGEENLLLAREFSISARNFLGVQAMILRITACLVALVSMMGTAFVYIRNKKTSLIQN